MAEYEWQNTSRIDNKIPGELRDYVRGSETEFWQGYRRAKFSIEENGMIKAVQCIEKA